MDFSLQSSLDFLRGYLQETDRQKQIKKLNKLLAGKDYNINIKHNPITGEAIYDLSPKPKIPQGFQPQQATSGGITYRPPTQVPQDWRQRSITSTGKPTYRPPTRTEQYVEDMQKTIRGEVGWDELSRMYPEKALEVRKLKPYHTPVAKSPTFREGRGLPALISKDIANLSPFTKKAISNIKSQADLDELLDKRKEYEAQGVDVDAILEYFGGR